MARRYGKLARSRYGLARMNVPARSRRKAARANEQIFEGLHDAFTSVMTTPATPRAAPLNDAEF
jgi:hypothetical protein